MNLPLSCVAQDCTFVITGFAAEDSVCKRLLEIGMCINNPMSVLNKQVDGAMVIDTGDAKVAVDALIAGSIMVQLT